MITTTIRMTPRLSRPQQLEGWVERVDVLNRRLHLRTGSRDKTGTCILIPENCAIRHGSFDLRLQSLLPCDSVQVSYHEGDHGARIAQLIELATG